MYFFSANYAVASAGDLGGIGTKPGEDSKPRGRGEVMLSHRTVDHHYGAGPSNIRGYHAPLLQSGAVRTCEGTEHPVVVPHVLDSKLRVLPPFTKDSFSLRLTSAWARG